MSRIEAPEPLIISLDTVALVIVLFNAIVYNGYIIYKARTRDGSIMLSISLTAGPQFVAKHLIRDDAGSTTLMVQTLRNTLIVGVFLAGGALNSALAALEGLNAESLLTLSLRGIRQVLLSTFLFLAFLNFAIVLRSAIHLGYMVGVATGKVKSEMDVAAARQGSSGYAIIGPPKGSTLSVTEAQRVYGWDAPDVFDGSVYRLIRRRNKRKRDESPPMPERWDYAGLDEEAPADYPSSAAAEQAAMAQRERGIALPPYSVIPPPGGDSRVAGRGTGAEVGSFSGTATSSGIGTGVGVDPIANLRVPPGTEAVNLGGTALPLTPLPMNSSFETVYYNVGDTPRASVNGRGDTNNDVGGGGELWARIPATTARTTAVPISTSPLASMPAPPPPPPPPSPPPSPPSSPAPLSAPMLRTPRVKQQDPSSRPPLHRHIPSEMQTIQEEDMRSVAEPTSVSVKSPKAGQPPAPIAQVPVTTSHGDANATQPSSLAKRTPGPASTPTPSHAHAPPGNSTTTATISHRGGGRKSFSLVSEPRKRVYPPLDEAIPEESETPHSNAPSEAEQASPSAASWIGSRTPISRPPLRPGYSTATLGNMGNLRRREVTGGEDDEIRSRYSLYSQRNLDRDRLASQQQSYGDWGEEAADETSSIWKQPSSSLWREALRRTDSGVSMRLTIREPIVRGTDQTMLSSPSEVRATISNGENERIALDIPNLSDRRLEVGVSGKEDGNSPRKAPSRRPPAISDVTQETILASNKSVPGSPKATDRASIASPRARGVPEGTTITPLPPRTVRYRHKVVDIPIEAILAAQSEKLIQLVLMHTSLGFRSFYLAIPFAFAGAGSIAFIVSAIVMQFFLIYIDFSVS